MVLVSVIIPMYNTSEYIENTINSILKQSLQDFEIICVDDCSTDNSYEIVHEISKNDERIMLYRMDINSGSGKCRNLALDVAQGRYVSFLDSDDVYHDNRALELLVKEAEKSNVMMASGNMVFKITDNTNNNYKLAYSSMFFKPSTTLEKLGAQDYGIPWYYYKSIFRLYFLNKHNIRFPDLKRGQDTVFMAKVLANIDSYIQLPVRFYEYNSPTQSKLTDSLKYIDYFKSFKMVFEIFIENNYDVLVNEFAQELLKYSQKPLPNFTQKQYELLLDEFNQMEALFEKFGDELLLWEVKRLFRTLSTMIYHRLNKTDVMISVIVPVYNVEKYLDDCLNSLICQTYDNIEIICVEDCSTDNSREVLEYYASIDDRIKIIYNPTNMGLGASRNNGMEVACGKYLLFIDSDDWLDFNALEQLLFYAEGYELEVLMFKMINYEQESNEFYHEEYYDMPKLKHLEYRIFNHKLINKNLLFDISVSACHKMYLNSFLKDINAKFPVNIINEDNPFFYKVFCEANRYFIINEYFYNRRRHSESLTTRDDTFVLTSLDILEAMLKIFLENKYYNYYKVQLSNYMISIIKFKYDTISDKHKRRFYEESTQLVEELFTKYDIAEDFNNSLDESNRKFFDRLCYSTDYDEFVMRKEYHPN